VSIRITGIESTSEFVIHHRTTIRGKSQTKTPLKRYVWTDNSKYTGEKIREINAKNKGVIGRIEVIDNG
jgi:hypothetical protein